MATVTVNISFRDSFLKDIDKIARRESRSRSELLREAARMYIERKKRWGDIFALGDRVSAAKGLRQDDVAKEISAYRKQNRKRAGR